MWKTEAKLGVLLITLAVLVMCSEAYAGCDQVRIDAAAAMECRQARGGNCKASIQKKGSIYHAMRISLYQYPLHFGEKWKEKVIKRYSFDFYIDCKRGLYGAVN